MKSMYALVSLFLVSGLGTFFLIRTHNSFEEQVVDERGKQEISIVLSEEGFSPRFVRISRGARVVFTTTREHPFWPASNEHPSHTLYPDFDSKEPIMPGASWEFRFSETGERPFHDHIRSYYNGTIYVEE